MRLEIKYFLIGKYVLSDSQDKVLAAKYSVDEFPSLVFFENQIPSKIQI